MMLSTNSLEPAGRAHDVALRVRQVWRAPPKLTVSEWSDVERRLSPESSAAPGRWSTSSAEYQRGIMDALSDPMVTTVVAMTSAQVGKTEVLNNAIGYYIAQDPAPILVIQPTLEMGEAWSKDRLAPMLRDTPALHGKVKDPRTRDSGNTLLHKVFPGGHLTIAGANSPAGLAMRPIRILLCDEVDRYPPSAGTEGDPISLARRRTANFWNRKVVLTSTPTVKGYSRIEAEWNLSDQRRYFVPCPHCGEHQYLTWAQVRWPDGEPQRALYHCGECGAEWSENARRAAIRWGKWQATATGNGSTAGFHLNEIYSPWARLGDMAQSFLEAKRTPETLKTWVNTSLGETWEEDAEKIDGHDLMSRLEDWGDAAPNGVLIVTCGVDVQADRIEVERVGWGLDEESWSLEHRIIYGEPQGPDIWAELDDYLLTPTVRHDGAQLPVHATAVDSGFHTQRVYTFCRDRTRRKVCAIKGVAGPGRPAWPPRASKVKHGKVNLFIVGVDAGKDAVYARLRIDQPGPGYCHFPKGRDHAFFEQLTAEVVKTKFSKGFPARVYELPNGKRNEALDLRVYAYAALQSLPIRWRRPQDAPKAVAPPQQEHRQPAPEPAQHSAPPSPAVVRHAARPRRVGKIGGMRW